jgi:hypothetical protein
MPKIRKHAHIAEKRTARRYFGGEKDPSFDLSQSILVRHHITLATGQHTIPNNTTGTIAKIMRHPIWVT